MSATIDRPRPKPPPARDWSDLKKGSSTRSKLLRNAWAVIFDSDQYGLQSLGHRHVDLVSKFNGVIAKIGDRARDGKRPASGKKPVRPGVSDGVADIGKFAADRLQDACDVDELDRLGRIVVSKIVQALDEQACDPIDVGEQGVLLTALPHPLHAQLQPRQRCAQIMADAAQHAGAGFDHQTDPPAHAVQCPGQCNDLDRSPLLEDRRTRGDVGNRRRLGDALYGFRDRPDREHEKKTINTKKATKK